MSETQTVQEQKLSDPCQRRHCNRESPVRVPVYVAGETVHWCPDCVEEEFDVDYADHVETRHSPLRYVTPETVTAFLLGVTLMLVIASVMVV